MKAIELTETGGPEVMHLREIPTPIPQESEVLIRVAVTGVNFIDLYVPEGRYGNELPFTPGQEAAGTVVAVGKSVSHLYGSASGDVPPLDLMKLASFGSLYVTRPILRDYTLTRAELLDR